MQIVNATSKGDPRASIAIEHKGTRLLWDFHYYASNNSAPIEQIFDHINRYWQTLDETRLEKIFGIYSSIHQTLTQMVEPTMIHQQLIKQCRDLYEQMPYEEIRFWAMYHGNIKVPSSIKDDHSELDIANRYDSITSYEESTYLRKDYVELVNLAVWLRPMVPIWAEYMEILKRLNNKSKFSEMKAMSVIGSSGIMEVEPMKRLHSFIVASINRSREKQSNGGIGNGTIISAALGGLGDAEIPEWFLSIAVVRKIVVLDLTPNAENNLISTIYHNINSNARGISNKFMGNISYKIMPKGDEDEENKSILETYKIKERLSEGDLRMLSIFTEDITALSRNLDPNMDSKLLGQCHDTIRRLESFVPVEGQLVLVRWVLSPVLSPYAIDNINKVSLLNCMALTQAYLWQYGWPDLALLVAADQVRDSMGEFIGGLTDRSQIPKEYFNSFLELYPHYQSSKSKESFRKLNPACKAVDAMTTEFARCDWRAHAPESLRECGTTIDERRVLTVPSNIKRQFSSLVYHLAMRQRSNHYTKGESNVQPESL